MAKTVASKNKRKRRSELREVGRKDRITFADGISKISNEQLSHVVDTVREQCPAALLQDMDSVEIEIDKIDSQTLLDLNEYVAQAIKSKKIPEKKVQPSK
eukprot:CAMPEP_0167762236 /NCGR_PEP_ID=MMETSP0110_2-20121227/12645_1 /TAXON_ID=629695 /ORGANISM="Gymnochlora sp., Strain CCMP2014" /LENGTH=99 /DNA_ID=CAMNT_0007649067 /DNA_START=358 /DNA_END=657 /DNA_ORIENTATION=+